MSLLIRNAVPEDAALVLQLIRELADFEKLLHEVEAREEDIRRDLFGPHPKVFAELAFWDRAPVGFSLWFYTYSTFQGRHGIWLEDLYVKPEARGRGIGKALIRDLARRCITEQLGRLEWWVLDWNESAIGFYKGLGGTMMDEWTKVRLTGDALKKLGTA